MNIIVLHPAGIETYKTWSQVKKETSWKKEDFAQVGTDYILNATGDTFEVMKDVKLLETVAAQKMFTKNKIDFFDLVSVITLILVFISVVS